MAMLYDTAEAAKALGVSRRRVLQIAEVHQVGTRLSAQWVFSDGDIAKLRAHVTGKPGRPKEEPRPCTEAGCGAASVARGLCSRHYQALRRREESRMKEATAIRSPFEKVAETLRAEQESIRRLTGRLEGRGQRSERAAETVAGHAASLRAMESLLGRMADGIEDGLDEEENG